MRRSLSLQSETGSRLFYPNQIHNHSTPFTFRVCSWLRPRFLLCVQVESPSSSDFCVIHIILFEINQKQNSLAKKVTKKPKGGKGKGKGKASKKRSLSPTEDPSYSQESNKRLKTTNMATSSDSVDTQKTKSMVSPFFAAAAPATWH